MSMDFGVVDGEKSRQHCIPAVLNYKFNSTFSCQSNIKVTSDEWFGYQVPVASLNCIVREKWVDNEYLRGDAVEITISHPACHHF